MSLITKSYPITWSSVFSAHWKQKSQVPGSGPILLNVILNRMIAISVNAYKSVDSAQQVSEFSVPEFINPFF